MILISAGHHPYSKGANYNGFHEYDEAKIWASLIAHHVSCGSMVVPSGVLKEKVAFINSQKGVDIAIEIHFNSAKNKSGDHVGKGCETLHYPGSEQGIKAATMVQESLSSIFPPDRGIKEGWFRMDPNNGVDYFLARTLCTALIIEPEFIHEKEKIESNRNGACAAIAQALLQFSNAKKDGLPP